MANFAIEGDIAEQLGRRGTDGFDASVEFLYPEKDFLWNGKPPETTAPDNIKRAVIRLWQFIKDCTPRGVDPSTMTEAEVRRAFVSEKFKREVGQYFDVRNLTLWWVLTDYHMSVDPWGAGGQSTAPALQHGIRYWSILWRLSPPPHPRGCLVLANLEEELKASVKLLRQPEYTILEIDDNVADPGAITNLDNGTGYGTGKPYEPSGHIKAILSARFQCVGKQATKGEMYICPLHIDDSSLYYDGLTNAEVLRADGDTWVYEPEYWYKGVNDLIRGKKYICFASSEPEGSKATVLALEGIEVFRNSCFSSTRGNKGQACLSSRSRQYDVHRVEVEGYRRIRVPMALGLASEREGGAFVDADDNIIERVHYPSIDGHLPNMYLILDIPEGAKSLYFQVSKVVRMPEMIVVLTQSKSIIDLEPKYCHHRERLVGAYPAYFSEGGNPTIGSFASSNYESSRHIYSQPYSYFETMFAHRGLKLTDYDSYKHIALLMWAKYGTRAADLNGSNVSSVGSHSANTGMQDVMGNTMNTYYINSRGERKLVWGYSHDASSHRFSSRFMGYARMFSNNKEFVADLTIPANLLYNDETFRFTAVLDGERSILISHKGQEHLRRIALGLHCDPLIAHRTASSPSSHYLSDQDIGHVPSSKHRVLIDNSGARLGGIAYKAVPEDSQADNLTARPMCSMGVSLSSVILASTSGSLLTSKHMDYKIIHSDSTLPLLEVFNSEHNTWLLRWQGRQKGEYIECLHQGKPTLEEVKHIVLEWYNAETDKRILSGFRYEGHLVWLSRENQINYKAAYDLAFQLGGQMGTLPATFKLGTDEEPHFHTFATLEDLQSFYLSTVQHIRACYQAGWEAKNKIDWSVYETTE